MGNWEQIGKSDEWYTPKYIFDALDCRFDLDAAAPWDRSGLFVPADNFISTNYLTEKWFGFVWLNPPFGERNSKSYGLNKMKEHGNGIVLTPDRSSAPWWQEAAIKACAHLQISGKVKFIRPKHTPAPWERKVNKQLLFHVLSSKHIKFTLMDGSSGDSPSTGTTLFAYGSKGVNALINGENNGLGLVFKRLKLF